MFNESGDPYLGSVQPPLTAAGIRGERRWSISASTAGVLGFIASLCILIGVAQSGSPFTSKLPHAWFFGLGNGTSGAGSDGTFLGIVLVYLGVALMIGTWYELVRMLRRNPATPVKTVVAVIAAWAAPIMAMPPLFSRDIYSYAAQGEMVSRGLSPYLHGPTVLGANDYVRLVSPMWRGAQAPYGPAWERLSGGIVQLVGHDVVATVIGFRFVAAIGVGLIVWGVPTLARSVGRDPATALTLAVLNPLVLLVLLGGAHNDALMLGLVIAGCAAARRHHVLIGLVLCTLAAEVKIPALIGALFIGWWWSEGAGSQRQRVVRVASAILISLVLLTVIGLLSGLGWGWIDGLSKPGMVVSWADPVTAVGLALSHAAGALGFGSHAAAYVQWARAAGLVMAAVISAGLVLRSARLGAIRALGWSMLAVVVLGPVVWPWYETWGFVLLAVVAEAWTLRLVMVASAISCFANIPGLHYFTSKNPALTIVSWTLLAGMIVVYGVLRMAPPLNRLRSPTVPSHFLPASDPSTSKHPSLGVAGVP
jgi:alpha-1,6-mannosyltransferase